jgi:hypothetical protein
MKVVMLYRPKAEFSRQVEEFAKTLEDEHRARIKLESLNTREGASMASLYDIIQYPAILVLGDDGHLVKSWEGKDFPLKDEVSYYTHH